MRETIWVVYDDGTKAGFEVLSVRQIMTTCDLLSARLRKQILDDAKASNAPSEMVMKMLADARNQTDGMHDIVKSCFTWQGALDIISFSNENETAKAMENLSPTEISKLALRLINHEIDAEGKLQSRTRGSVGKA